MPRSAQSIIRRDAAGNHTEAFQDRYCSSPSLSHKSVLLTVAAGEGRRNYLTCFLRSCERLNISPVVLGKGANYHGHGDKIRFVSEYLRRIGPQVEHVVYADAFDTVILDPLETITEKLTGGGFSLVFSAEKCCYPDPWKENLYPVAPGPWRFLNSGFWAGHIESIRRLFALIPLEKLPSSINDQQVFTDLFLSGKTGMQLDYRVEFCQNLHSAELDIILESSTRRIVNRLFATRPSVIHGNGRYNMDRIVRFLGL